MSGSMTIIELARAFSNDVKEKAMECETVEEIMALAKENNVLLTEEIAREILKASASGDLTDEELDAVAGGKNCCEWQQIDCGIFCMVHYT